jgi:hypothetical protein
LAETFPCLCCGHRTLPAPQGSFEICPVCFWQDDGEPEVAFEALGANPVSLQVARENFRAIGACEPRMVPFVRAARPEEGPARAPGEDAPADRRR